MQTNKIDINDERILEFLSVVDEALFYYHPTFLSLASEILKADCYYLVLEENSQFQSLLPVMVKCSHTGTVFNSLAYYGSNGGVLQRSKCDTQETLLLKEFFSIAQKEDAVSATVICNPFLGENVEIWTNLAVDTEDYRIGQVTKLPKTENALMEIFEHPRPRNIRKALKSDIKVKINHNTDFLYETHFDNIVSIGGKPKDKEFFEAIPKHVPYENWKVYTATLDEQEVAALLVFYGGKTVEYYTPATKYKYRNLQPSSLLIFNAMKDAIADGYEYWNWGGTWETQKGVYDFKKKWGATDMLYNYKTKIFKPEIIFNLSKDEILEFFPGFYVVNFVKRGL